MIPTPELPQPMNYVCLDTFFLSLPTNTSNIPPHPHPNYPPHNHHRFVGHHLHHSASFKVIEINNSVTTTTTTTITSFP